ncbi:HEPN/Toprim-associated domain-containing protein [Pantoea agglomerans]|uniref:HEPN/Toprim-associated domain-containing protein n=1 Tax=Enterobacter agglomerans TaxID=549 RepID=UPI00320B9CE2
MSTWVSIVVNGLEFESFQNTYHQWFFKSSDRVRELLPLDDDDHDDCEHEFIGYKASAATIRRRMLLAGYDTDGCNANFIECRDELILSLEAFFSKTNRLSKDDGIKDNPPVYSWEYHLAAIQNSELEDWTSLFQEAARIKQQRQAERRSYREPQLLIVGSDPLLNAMISDFDFLTTYTLTGPMNFPCSDANYFWLAFLTSCPGDVIIELNIAPLIRSGYVEDFTDLHEIQQNETQPHSFCRQSIEDTVTLSGTLPDNLSLQRMCYSSIITAMEAYLSDILKREIFERPAVKERFVSSYEPFKKQKFTLSEIYTRLSVIDAEIKEALDGLSLHKIETAKNIFSSTLLTEFPGESLRHIGAAVKLRHDIVHRNGRNTEGIVLTIDRQAVEKLAREVLCLTQEVDAQILDGLLHEHSTDDD